MTKFNNENILWTIIQSTNLLLANVDKDLNFLTVNEAYAQWFELKPYNIIGTPLRDIVGEMAFLKLYPYLEIALTGEIVSFELEFPNYRNGKRVLRINYLPNIQDNDEISGLFLILEDVTNTFKSEDIIKKKKRFYLF